MTNETPDRKIRHEHAYRWLASHHASHFNGGEHIEIDIGNSPQWSCGKGDCPYLSCLKKPSKDSPKPIHLSLLDNRASSSPQLAQNMQVIWIDFAYIYSVDKKSLLVDLDTLGLKFDLVFIYLNGGRKILRVTRQRERQRYRRPPSSTGLCVNACYPWLTHSLQCLLSCRQLDFNVRCRRLYK